MKVCPNCQNEQEAGKFCGACGTALIEQAKPEVSAPAAQASIDQQAATTEAPAQPSAPFQEERQSTTQEKPSVNPITEEQMDRLKSSSKHYVNFFIEKLKTPSATPDLKLGLTNIIVFLLLMSIAFFVLINKQAYLSSPFISTIFSVSFGLALFISISLLAIFITTLFSQQKPTFKQIVAQYGNYSSVTIALSLVALILFIFHSFVIGMFIFSLTLAITFVVQPTFIINRYIQTLQFGFDKYFIYLLFIVIQAILYVTLLTVIADSTLGEFLDHMWFLL